MMRLPTRVVQVVSVGVLTLAQVALAAGEARLEPPYAADDVTDLIIGLMRAVALLALPVIALFIVVAGFKFVAAQGNESKINEAKENIKYVIIGAALILGAWVLATLIGGTVKQVLGS